MRAAGAIAFGTVLSLLAFASCGGNTEVTIELLDPCTKDGTSFRAAADYVEFAVFPSKCPDDTLLAAGLTSSARYRKVVKASAGLPEVGDLPKEKFGFAAVLRDENCGVIGFGCTNADLENTKKIIVAVRAWATPAGKNDPSAYCTPLTGGGCPPSKVCSNGNCKSVNEDDAGGCTLAIAAGGKLPAPIVEGARVSGPAITATDSGFVMAYRDQDPSSGFPRVIVYYVSDQGEPNKPGVFDLVGCPTKELTDGVGATYANGGGLIATSLPNCDALKGAGAVFLPFDDQGLVSNAAGPQNAAFNDLTVGPVSSVAPGAADGDFEVVIRTVTSQPAIERIVLKGSDFKDGVSIVHPFGDGDYPFGLVATSSQVRALLAPTSATQTQVIIGTNVGDTLDAAPSTMTLDNAGAWAALAAWSNRVAAAVPASSGITLKVGQLGAASGEAGSPEIFSGTIGSSTAAGGAIAVLRSHLFVAHAKAGGVTLYNLEDADGTIKLPTSAPAPTEGGTEGGSSSAGAGIVELQTNLGDATLANFSGAQIAMAAARNRVAIVWLTKPKLGDTDPTGGWALLRCNE